MPNNGTIIKNPDGSITIKVKREPYSLGAAGVLVENPEVEENERIYTKTFTRKPIYLSQEYARAIAERVHHPDNFVISMNGYSRISEEQCRRYGIQNGAYEHACAAILRRTIKHLRQKFDGAKLRLIYGASDIGVDAAVELVAHEFNIVPLGFSCPRFMLYVKDDDTPVYVAESIEEYADAYIRSLDLLIATGGREHALQHDVYAACIYNKRIHFVDVLNNLSESGGVPAIVREADGRVRVDNAAAAMGKNVSFFTREETIALPPPGGDIWDAIFLNVASVATAVCRQKLSPERKF